MYEAPQKPLVFQGLLCYIDCRAERGGHARWADSPEGDDHQPFRPIELVAQEEASRQGTRVVVQIHPSSFPIVSMAPKKLTMSRTAWVWFKNGLGEPGCWKAGFRAVEEPYQGFYRMEHTDYRTETLPAWRVAFVKPADMMASPFVPAEPMWRHFSK